jgi:17beta-estradiol 17-dehydrogenase / very-long-chain 3-oxoacyl-CoA reductase
MNLIDVLSLMCIGASRNESQIVVFTPHSELQVPLYVATKLAKIRKASLTVPSPETYAAAGLKWVGYEPRCTPYWVHSIMWWFVQSLPEPIVDSFRLRSSLGIRKRGQAKDARGKAE